MMLMVSNCAMRPPPSTVAGLSRACDPPATNKPSAITTFTSGPATAIINSCTGSSGMRSSRATPPIGSNVISGVLIPKAFAANACPNSCSTTQRKSSRTNMTRLDSGTALRIIAEGQPGNQQQERDVNPQLNTGDAEDWERPAHLSQFALVLNRAPAVSKPDWKTILNRR